MVARLTAQSMTWKGRRLLYSRYHRFVSWEFWRVWALYPFVACYIAWQMLKHRSVTLPTAVNPCMTAGGLVYESKSEILGHLEARCAPIARFAVAPLAASLETKQRQVDDFLKTRRLDYPVVLKPDVGQRGQGVAIARSAHYFLGRFETQLDAVLPSGEVFPLATVGTHARGALFLDGAELITS